MNMAGIYEYEIRRHFSVEDLVKRNIPYQPKLKLHLISTPARGLDNVLPELSQPTGYLRRLTYKQNNFNN
jgi:hypothetical protein